jgi:hypothetical protein
MEERQQRVATHSEQSKARKGMVEHPFGTMKRWRAPGDVLTRGRLKGQGEMRLPLLVYNLKRVLNILGGAAWLTAVAERA